MIKVEAGKTYITANGYTVKLERNSLPHYCFKAVSCDGDETNNCFGEVWTAEGIAYHNDCGYNLVRESDQGSMKDAANKKQNLVRTKSELNKRTRSLLRAFDASAKAWGWEQDIGFGPSVRNAENTYAADKRALEQHLLRLQRQIQTLKKKLSSVPKRPVCHTASE